MMITLADLRQHYDRMTALSDVVDSHNHGEFESCDVCKECGIYDLSVRAYENAAIRYVDSLMHSKETDGVA